ncbi:CC-NBS-LRR class disease resistance protein, putative isoform 1 [Hibiscus syriacus]|uniref:CC-NBS-LRR class disease resistance protein, putative isoform 1 n=1 Tax=Hibiscus syriacus TaxID=106335 RepID=A0A6A3C1Y3_HIBSY|nr:receptor-like protein kinase FERONIA [Hibiscus syriacus]KAE8722307.1 CC-NBS-LRR class disease resistance protein, putative isoform 1 [Hibiscus syriacus]
MGSCSHSLPSFSKVLKEIKSKIRRTKSNTLNRSLPDELCHRISLTDIKAATNNFHKNKIIANGDTGFIYGGKINGGFYAIKRLIPTSDSLLPLVELRCGAEILCQLRHPNILSLIGFCDEKKEMIHVYEYVNNGSLHDNLHSQNYDPIPWKRRLEICIGVARALHYLHTGAKFILIHRDVSSKNILLDDQWTSKLCNFGFCKRGPLSLSRGTVSIEVESDITYTFACLAPEVARTSRVSTKSDVFSFGVVLFEVLCRRRVFDAKLQMEQRFLYTWARKCIENGTIYSIIDPYLKGKISPQCLKKFLEIAYSCVQYEENKRPTMGEVEATLELALELQKQEEYEMESINPQGEFICEEA